jgi:hypothetical protein
VSDGVTVAQGPLEAFVMVRIHVGQPIFTEQPDFLATRLEICEIYHLMSTSQATAEVFVTAFKSLKRRERDAVVERMLADDELREDLVDTLALESRRHEPRSSFRQVLKRTQH